MDWTLWAMFVLTEGALTITPGPAVLFVVSQGLRAGSADALWSAVGILVVNSLYFAISGTSLGTLLVASGRLFEVVRWLGAGYLLSLAAVALLRPPLVQGSDEAPDASATLPRNLFVRGFALQLSNPKALLFFVAILPQFFDRSRPVVGQLLLLGVTSIVLELVVLATYAAAAARAARIAAGPRFAKATNRLGGVLLAGAALGLLRVRH